MQVQPGDGFGTILAKETITLDVIFQPDRANEYNFELSCKTLINRYQTFLGFHLTPHKLMIILSYHWFVARLL